jgi:hypothetical protein
MRNRFLARTGLAILSLCAAGLAPGAFAASVSATSQITGVTPTLLTLTNNQFLSDASIPGQSGFNTSSVLTGYNFNSSSGGNTSFAQIDASFAPLPATSAGAVGNGNGSASVLWTFDWEATGTGTAALDFEYLFSATVANWLAGQTGVASSSISAVIDGTSVQGEALRFFNNTNGNDGGFANLALNFGVTAGQRGTATVTVASVASAAQPVPLPAALPLLGGGLLGLFGLGRRRRREQAA